MGYIFLIFALFSGVTKGYCGKKTSGYTSTLQSAVFANTIRMLLCTVIGLILIVANGDLPLIIPSKTMLLTSALSGISTAVFVVCWLVCVRKNAYMLLDIFLTLGILIPLILSNLIFCESIKLTQWIGISLLFTAVIVMCSYSKSLKGKLTFTAVLLLIVCGISNGIADFSQKLFTKTSASSAAVFNFYTYVFASIILLIALAFVNKTNTDNVQLHFKKIFGYIVVMAICLFLNSYFKTLSARYLNAVILYPLSQGGALILSTLMATAIFKEKLTLKAVIGIIVAFSGLLIINLL